MSAAVALHPSARAPRRPGIENCPVAALADEASDLILAWKGLNAAIQTQPDALGLSAALGEPEPPADEDEITAAAVQSEITTRLNAIGHVVMHRQATSLKGAAFQAIVLNHHLCDVREADIDGPLKGEVSQRFRNACDQVERGLESIVVCLASNGDGIPAHVREYYGYQPRLGSAAVVARAVDRFRVR
jgi:hypothetical protein|uniref:Uncharacterized protein n=1 Tax=viral metagenome TaxID=1070528 RepID=A0A6M3XPF1_9ZZZZ